MPEAPADAEQNLNKKTGGLHRQMLALGVDANITSRNGRLENVLDNG